MEQLVKDTLAVMDIEDAELVTLYYGADVEPEAADALLEALQEVYTELEFELYHGAQAVYSYLIYGNFLRHQACRQHTALIGTTQRSRNMNRNDVLRTFCSQLPINIYSYLISVE